MTKINYLTILISRTSVSLKSIVQARIRQILFVATLMLSLTVSAQDKEIIYIRIQENIAGSCESYLKIAYPEQTAKSVQLKELGRNGKRAEENGKVIQKELSTLINSGYEIASSSTGADQWQSTTVIILTRKK